MHKRESGNAGKQMYSKQLNRCLCFYRHVTQLLSISFHCAILQQLAGKKLLEGQLFPARLQECVCVGHARDCSLPPPPTHSEQLWCPEGCSYGSDPHAPPPQPAQSTQASAGQDSNWGGLLNLFLQATRLLPASDQDHPASKVALLLLGETSIMKKCQKGQTPQLFSKLTPKLCTCSGHLHPCCQPSAGA